MRIFKNHPLLSLINGYLIDAPQPSNLSYLWNFGSLLAFCLVLQIVTGVTLAIHYNPSVAEAFNSVVHIMRDVNNGWLIRYLHSNTTSAFFFLVYLHVGRVLYFGSYKATRTLVWIIVTIILVLMMATAFFSFVIPHTQYVSLRSYLCFPLILLVLYSIHLIGLHDSPLTENNLGIRHKNDIILKFIAYTILFSSLFILFLIIISYLSYTCYCMDESVDLAKGLAKTLDKAAYYNTQCLELSLRIQEATDFQVRQDLIVQYQESLENRNSLNDLASKLQTQISKGVGDWTSRDVVISKRGAPSDIGSSSISSKKRS